MTIPNPDSLTKLHAGQGVIHIASHGTKTSFPALQFSYPLKLISPHRQFHPNVGCLYILSYGGGLVAGDRVGLQVKVDTGAKLVLLTQGSTKVFKTRPGRYPTAAPLPDGSHPTRTVQQMSATVQPGGSLFLLPSPVTCFSQSDYSQLQSFRLDSLANLCLLDWYTSGRASMSSANDRPVLGEEWQFTRFRSSNTIIVDGKPIAKDVLLLAPGSEGDDFAPRVLPYSTYATLFLIGPELAPIRKHLALAFAQVVQYPQSMPYSMLWSYSELDGEVGVARCAGAGTEIVRDWVRQVLEDGGITDLIGEDLWLNAFT